MGETANATTAQPRASHQATESTAMLSDVQRKAGLQTIKNNVVSETGRQIQQADIEVLHSEIHDLKQAQTRVQTFYGMKFQALRQCFEQKIQAFTTTLSS